MSACSWPGVAGYVDTSRREQKPDYRIYFDIRSTRRRPPIDDDGPIKSCAQERGARMSAARGSP